MWWDSNSGSYGVGGGEREWKATQHTRTYQRMFPKRREAYTPQILSAGWQVKEGPSQLGDHVVFWRWETAGKFELPEFRVWHETLEESAEGALAFPSGLPSDVKPFLTNGAGGLLLCAAMTFCIFLLLYFPDSLYLLMCDFHTCLWNN